MWVCRQPLYSINYINLGSIHLPIPRRYALGIILLLACLPANAQYPGEPIQPLPLELELNADWVRLGEQLFHDPRLSSSGAMACANCHQLNQAGTDGMARSITNDGSPDLINTPSIFNVVFNFRQTWRGAFKTLEEQAEADLHNPRHANLSWPEILAIINSIPDYLAEFERLFADNLQAKYVLTVIAEYERSLITPNAPFDRYLRGETGAITELQREGYMLFKAYGCISCHQGINVGGNLFQRIGIFAEYKPLSGQLSKADLGLFNVSGREQDKLVFKVPSLRNVALTGPYLHSGEITSLDEVVSLMGRLQLGRAIPDKDIIRIVAFLESLTGEYRGVPLTAMDANQ